MADGREKVGNVMGRLATSPAAQPAGVRFLAGDIGGTHARIGWVRGWPGHSQVDVLACHTYRCADYPGLGAIVRAFLDGHVRDRVARAVLACAGYVLDGKVINDNLPWKVTIDSLRAQIGFADLRVINDFEAVAYATQYLDPAATVLLTHSARAFAGGPRVVVGPGTGLGSAVLLDGRSGPRVLATEAGQVALAPGNALEAAILRVLADSGDYISYEYVLSGPGLLHLFRALCTLEGTSPQLATPEAVTAAARGDRDPLARRTLEVFCAILGSFAGDLAMLYGATGGIWLAGGILPQIRDFLVRSAFVARFADKGRMRTFLERVPVRLMEHGQLGVIGAAGWLLEHGAPIDTTPSTLPAAPDQHPVAARDGNSGM